jgi:hypothetical protein
MQNRCRVVLFLLQMSLLHCSVPHALLAILQKSTVEDVFLLATVPNQLVLLAFCGVSQQADVLSQIMSACMPTCWCLHGLI